MYYTIYTITVNHNVYVGATSNFKSRLQTHYSSLNRIIEKGRIELRNSNYCLFDVSELQQHGYSINIFCFTEDSETAKLIEQRLINKYKAAGRSLNMADKSGLSINYSRKKIKKGRTLSQLLYIHSVLNKNSPL